MLTKEKIDRFYKDVESLGLKFPVAEISRLTGYSKGNVSGYLKGKVPSENFIIAFYKKFEKSLANVPREQLEENEMQDEWPGIKNARSSEPTERELMALLLQAINRQNKILDRQQDDTIDRLKLIEANLNRVAGKAEGLQYDLISGRETVLRSLSRLENKAEETLLNEADRLRKSLAMANHELSKTGVSGK